MRLTVFNGSPRGSGSNTKILVEKFLQGFHETPENTSEIIYLNRINKQDEFVQAFCESDHVILATPLYTDAMPAMVKTFIESLAGMPQANEPKTIGFIIQSGFGEAIHSRYLERYFKKLAGRLGCRYVGTIVKGGVEGIQVQPPVMTRKMFSSFYQLGLSYGTSGEFDNDILHSLAKRELYSPAVKFLLYIMTLFGLTDAYWNGQLKKNNAFSKRFDKPYLSDKNRTP